MMNFGTKASIVLVSFVFFHVTEGFQKPERQQVGFHKPEDTEMPPFFKEHNPEPRMPFPDIAFETEEPVSVEKCNGCFLLFTTRKSEVAQYCPALLTFLDRVK